MVKKPFYNVFFFLTGFLFLLALLYNSLVLGISSLLTAIDMLKQKSYSLNFGTSILSFALSIVLLICIIGIVYNILHKHALNAKKIQIFNIFISLTFLCICVLNILDVGYFDMLKYFTVSVFTFDFTFGVSVIPFLCSLTYLNIVFCAFLLCQVIFGTTDDGAKGKDMEKAGDDNQQQSGDWDLS